MTTRRRAPSPACRSSRSSGRASTSEAAALLAASLLAAGCRPEFDVRSSQVTGLRILAVQSSPAEAAPGADVAYGALVVDPKGERTDAAVDWAYCNESKPLSDLN